MSEKDNSAGQKRQYFRIIYPSSGRPIAYIKRQKFEVLDISEGGCKVLVVNPAEVFAVGEKVKGSIVFRDESSIKIRGEILRFEANAVVIRMPEGVPQKKIMEEQLKLIATEA